MHRSNEFDANKTLDRTTPPTPIPGTHTMKNFEDAKQRILAERKLQRERASLRRGLPF